MPTHCYCNVYCAKDVQLNTKNNALLLNAVILQVRVEFSMPCACHRIAIQCCTKQCRIAVIYVCFALHCLSLVTRVLKFLFTAKNAKGPPQFLPINIHESFSKRNPFMFSSENQHYQSETFLQSSRVQRIFISAQRAK